MKKQSTTTITQTETLQESSVRERILRNLSETQERRNNLPSPSNNNNSTTNKTTYDDFIKFNCVSICFIKNMGHIESYIQCQEQELTYLVNVERTKFFIVLYESDNIIPIDEKFDKFKLLNEYVLKLQKNAKKMSGIKYNPFIKCYKDFTKKSLYYRSYLLSCESITKRYFNNKVKPIFIPLPYNSYCLNLSFYNLGLNDLI